MLNNITPVMDGVTNLAVEIDGRELHHLWSYRATSPNLFNEILPNHNLWQYSGCSECTPGTYQAVADGYYLMLAPLSRGSHTIHFYGEIASLGFSQDGTYQLTVGP